MSISQLSVGTTNHSLSSDADLSMRLRIALSIQRRAGWHLVRYTVKDGAVQLSGLVPTFYDQQLITILVRHVAGVFRIEDDLMVGDPAMRQQVIDDETILLPSDPGTKAAPFREPFRHVPVLAQSLDDMLVGPAVSVLHAT
jgi:hypothetical protein